jgi:hypothetical protein
MDVREKWFAFKMSQRGRQLENGLEKHVGGWCDLGDIEPELTSSVSNTIDYVSLKHLEDAWNVQPYNTFTFRLTLCG